MIFNWFQDRYFTRNSGYVADFCKICRKTSRFQLIQLNHQILFYHLPVFGTRITDYFKCCMKCKTTYAAEPRIYPVLFKKLEPLEEMLRSLPKHSGEIEERMMIENLILQSPDTISQDLRMKLLREPFFILSPEVNTRLNYFSLDSYGFYSFTFFIFLVFMTLSQGWLTNFSNDILIQLIFACAAGFLFIVLYKLSQRIRFIMNFLIPNLATALRPLKSAEEEIQIVISQMKAKNLKIGRLFSNKNLIRLSQALKKNQP